MSAENQAELLVPVEIIAKRDRLGLGRQLFGASGRSPHLTHTVSTPWGAVAIGREGARVTAHGDQIPVAAIEAPDPVGMAHVRRGLSGRVDGRDVRVVRPHFGLRRKDRSVLVDGEGIAWRSDYRRSRQFDILLLSVTQAEQERGRQRRGA